MPLRYSPEQIERWVQQFQSGLSYRQIATAESAPYPTVFWHVKKRLGLSGRPCGRKKVYVGLTEVDVQRLAKLKKQYNMTGEEYQAKMEAQGGKCAICGRTPEGWLHVDHDHRTKKNRGLLCNNCNLALGHLSDSIELFQAAIAYLRHHGE